MTSVVAYPTTLTYPGATTYPGSEAPTASVIVYPTASTYPGSTTYPGSPSTGFVVDSTAHDGGFVRVDEDDSQPGFVRV